MRSKQANFENENNNNDAGPSSSGAASSSNASNDAGDSRFDESVIYGLNRAKKAVDIPEEYTCETITQRLMREPVQCPDGYTYEREAIEEWIERNSTSPQTREEVKIDDLSVNRTVLRMVERFINRNWNNLDLADLYLPNRWVNEWKAALGESDLSKIKDLLEKAPELMGLKLDNSSRIGFHVAFESSSQKVIEFFIERLNSLDENLLTQQIAKAPADWRAMQHAVELDSLQLIDVLLDNGVESNETDPTGKTSLHHAAIAGCSELVKSLIERGARIDLKDAEGSLPLDLARLYKQKGVIAVLTQQLSPEQQVQAELSLLRSKNRKRKSQIAGQKQTIAEQAAKLDKQEQTILGQAAKIGEQEQTIAGLRSSLSTLRQEQEKLSLKTNEMYGLFKEKQDRKRRAAAEREAQEKARQEAEKRLTGPKLFEHIGRANDDDLKAVKEILAKYPELIFAQGKLVEPNEREFRHISAWQHVLWSGDPSLLSMLLDHVSANPDCLALARDQYDQLAVRPQELSDHGSNYDVQPLIDAEQKYLDNYGNWNNQQREDQWCKVIGGLQRELPAWIMYAWYEKGDDVAWVTKSLSAYTSVQEPDITRVKEALDWYLRQEYAGGILGSTWAVLRGLNMFGPDVTPTYVLPASNKRKIYVTQKIPYIIKHDVDVLKKCRQTPEAKDNLKSTLHAEECNIRASLRQ